MDEVWTFVWKIWIEGSVELQIAMTSMGENSLLYLLPSAIVVAFGFNLERFFCSFVHFVDFWIHIFNLKKF